MLLQESTDPIEFLSESLHAHFPVEIAFHDESEIQFAPFDARSFLDFFSELIGASLHSDIPEELKAGLAEELQITSLQAIRKEDAQRGLSLAHLSEGVYRLEFAILLTAPWKVGAVALEKCYLAFTIGYAPASGLSISAIIGAGKIKFFDHHLDLEVSVHVPSFLIKARFKTDQHPADSPAGMARTTWVP